MGHKKDRGYLTAGEVGALFHVSAKTVGRWAREGKIPYQATMGGHRRYDPGEIRPLVADLTETATNPPDLS